MERMMADFPATKNEILYDWIRHSPDLDDINEAYLECLWRTLRKKDYIVLEELEFADCKKCGGYTLIWSRAQIDRARKEGKELYEKLFVKNEGKE